MRDYGKVHTTFWTSTSARELSEDGRMLALYLLTCPHGTIAGVFRLPDGYACEDLQWDAERVSEGFKELFSNGFAKRCETTKWVWVVKHLDWNPPENPNQRKATAKVAAQIPVQCGWKQDFMRVCGPLMGFEPGPRENGSGTLAEGFLNQEQEQEQEQDKEHPDGCLSASQPTAGQQPLDGVPDPDLLLKTSAGIPPCPYDALIDLYHELCPAMPTVRRAAFKAGKRADAMRARWKWVMTEKAEVGDQAGQRMATTMEEGIAWFRKYFARAAESRFLNHGSGGWPGADIEFLMTASKFEALLEGRYHREEVAYA